VLSTDGQDLESAFTNFWTAEISDQRPPPTRIVVLGIDPHGDSPIPGTLILGDTAGLDLKNTIRAFGTEKPDEIRRLGKAEVIDLLERIDDYISARVIEIEGRRLRCSMFSL
jgi:hypothetical protein